MTRYRLFLILLIAAGPVCGLAATDLILPAIPILPTVVPGSAESAQWVLAAFAFGTGIGLLVFGELGARFRIGGVLVVSLFAFAGFSLAATYADSLVAMSAIRFLQGVAASAAAVFAPVMVKRLFSEADAVVMIGRLGSLEAMAPAVAPIVGAALLRVYGWQSTFYLVALVAAVLGLVWLVAAGLRAKLDRLERVGDGYLTLLRDAEFLRYALSQALTLAALLVIVFAAPKVVTASMGGEISDFIVMQILGIAFFVTAANMSRRFARWWGDEKTVLIGSALTAAGCAALLASAALAIESVPLLWFLFVLINLGLGVRGPTGFYKALSASGDNDARGSALIIFLVMLIAAAGTAVIARYIETGLLPVALAATVISVASVLILLFVPGRARVLPG